MDQRLLETVEELKTAIEADPRTGAYRLLGEKVEKDGELQAAKKELTRLLTISEDPLKTGEERQKALQKASLLKERTMKLPLAVSYLEALSEYRKMLFKIDGEIFRQNQSPSYFYERSIDDPDHRG